MVDLHRHDEFSFYDGSGKAGELAQIAKEKGLTALGLSNHGNTSGNVQHYDGCKAAGILMLPSSLTLFSRNAINPLGEANTVLFNV